MKRLLAGLGTALLVTIGGGAVGASTPPDTTPAHEAPAPIHQLVGTWSIVDTDDPEGIPFTGAFLSDGVYIEISDGDVSIGTFATTSATTAEMSYTSTDEEGSYTVRASITTDGATFTADYTIEVVAEGAPTGEHGPGQVEGTRVVADYMGEPVGTLDELFASFPEEGTEGTEVAEEGTEVATEGTEATAPPATEMAPPTTS